MPQPIEHARAVLSLVRDQLLARPNIVATGIGLKRTAGSRSATPCIVCSVAEKFALGPLSLRERVPAQIDGVPTDVVETGRLHALSVPTDRLRPAPGGVSIGHVAITAGTLGCWVRQNGEPMILSNNHVLANSNDANLGDAILQPGPHDGGRLTADQIAELAAFVPIAFLGMPSTCSVTRASAGLWNGIGRLLGSRARLRAESERVIENRVDAALARPLRTADVSDEILELGPIVDVASAELGLPVQKSGRTSGVTRGEILQVDVTADVQYGPGQLARFTDQLLAGPMSEGGDSGSAVLDEHGRLVGLLFAGSENTTIINRIEHVFEAFHLELPAGVMRTGRRDPLLSLSRFQPAREEKPDVTASIDETRARHADRLLDLPGVVSVGIGLDEEGRPVIVVGLAAEPPETRARLPQALEGHPVVTRQSGTLVAR